MHLEWQVNQVTNHRLQPRHVSWGPLQIPPELLWTRDVHHEFTWQYVWVGLRPTQFIVWMLHWRCLWALHNHCDQNPRWRRWYYWGRHWRRDERRSKFYLPAHRCTKTIILTSWNLPQSRKYNCAQIIRWNEITQPPNYPIPRGVKK